MDSTSVKKDIPVDSRRSKYKILIVDDAEGVRLLIRAILENDYEIYESDNAKNAIEMIGFCLPELVLLDQKLPDRDGLQILEEIKKQNLDCHCIMITGEGTLQLVVEALKKGAFDFLPKPIDAFTLIHTVKKAVENIELLHKNALIDK